MPRPYSIVPPVAKQGADDSASSTQPGWAKRHPGSVFVSFLGVAALFRATKLQGDLPDGSFSGSVSSHLQKNISALQNDKSSLYSLPSHLTKGRWPTSSTRGGMRWTLTAHRRTCPRRTAKSCGPGASTPASSLPGL